MCPINCANCALTTHVQVMEEKQLSLIGAVNLYGAFCFKGSMYYVQWPLDIPTEQCSNWRQKIETPKTLGSDLLYLLTQANSEIFFFVLYLLSVCMINFNKGGRSSFQK